MKNYKVKIKCVQTMEFVLPASAYEQDNIPVTAERISEMEEQNVMSDPTYFDLDDDKTTINVEVNVTEVKDA